MTYWEFSDKIRTKEDFHTFMNLLQKDWCDRHSLDRRQDGADTKFKAEPWENCYLPDFLEALQAWVDDSQTLPADFPYQRLAQILSAAVAYEGKNCEPADRANDKERDHVAVSIEGQ